MPVVRDIQITLNVPCESYDTLDATFEQFRRVAQHAVDFGWADDPHEMITNQCTLDDFTYDEVRKQRDLQSSLVQPARQLAATALTSCEERLFAGGTVSKPTFRGTLGA